jgi:hypothetical protein
MSPNPSLNSHSIARFSESSTESLDVVSDMSLGGLCEQLAQQQKLVAEAVILGAVDAVGAWQVEQTALSALFLAIV